MERNIYSKRSSSPHNSYQIPTAPLPSNQNYEGFMGSHSRYDYAYASNPWRGSTSNVNNQMYYNFEGNHRPSHYAAPTTAPRDAMNNLTIDNIMGSTPRYSIYSPPRYDTSSSSSTASPFSPIGQYETPDDLMRRSALYSNYSRGLSNQNSLTHRDFAAQRAAADRDLVTQADLLALQLGRSHIGDNYARVSSFNNMNLNPNIDGYYRDQESLSRTTRGRPDLIRPGFPGNSYASEFVNTSNNVHGRNYRLNTDYRRMHGNPNFGAEVGPRFQRDNFRGEVRPRFQRGGKGYGNYNGGNSMSRTPLTGDYEGNSLLMEDTIRSGNIFEIMKDEFGNYTFQNFLRLCDENQKREIVVRVSEEPKKLIEVATHSYGHMSFKTLIFAVKNSPELCNHLMVALYPELFNLMTKYSNGYTTIDFLLNRLGADHNLYIYDVALKHFSTLTRDKRGVIAFNHCIKKLFKFGDDETSATRECRNRLLSKVVDDCLQLATDAFGNYVVKDLLDLRVPEITTQLCEKLSHHVEEVSQNKSGSYVMERCLKSSAGEIVLKALVACKPEIRHDITMHPSGNFVIQTAMDLMKKLMPSQGKLAQAYEQFSGGLKCNVNARNVVKRRN